MKSPKKYSTSSNLDFRIQDTGYRIQNLGLSLVKTHKIKIYHRHRRAGGDPVKKELMAKPKEKTSLVEGSGVYEGLSLVIGTPHSLTPSPKVGGGIALISLKLKF